MVDLDYVINKLIPYRLGAVNALTHALGLRSSFEKPKPIKIYFDRKLTIVGNSNAYTNPVIDSGLIHCRALLEFLGICYTKNGLEIIKNRKPDDVGIEHYKDLNGVTLQKVSPEVAISRYPGRKEDAERALITIFLATNKGLAHVTSELQPQDLDFLEIASRGVDALVNSYLYTPLGKVAPDYKMLQVGRNTSLLNRLVRLARRATLFLLLSQKK
jgi:hypothetical protein